MLTIVIAIMIVATTYAVYIIKDLKRKLKASEDENDRLKRYIEDIEGKCFAAQLDLADTRDDLANTRGELETVKSKLGRAVTLILKAGTPIRRITSEVFGTQPKAPTT